MKYKLIIFCLFFAAFISCSSDSSDSEDIESVELDDQDNTDDDNSDDDDNDENEADTSSIIDFTNWKITLPVDENNNGSPDEVQPSGLVNGAYKTNSALEPYMYDDESDNSIEFYTVPESSTPNSSYSRTELRELINPSNSKENWSLEEGGEMKGRLKMVDISEDTQGSREFHRTIIMQIHGIVSIEDVQNQGLSSNSAPPLVKVYWQDGHVWSFKKSLVNPSTTGDDLYSSSNSIWFDEKVDMGYVGYEEFDLKITASDAKLELQLNDNQPLVYQDTSLNKWPFENYFKAGNYLQTSDEGSFAKLKYYNLSVTH